MRIKVSFLILSGILGMLNAQDTIIEFDRPGLADLPYINPLKTIQFEMGYELELDDSNYFSAAPSPSVLLRYSPIKYFEFRFAINYQPVSTHHARYYSSNNLFGFAAGTKVKICKEKGLRPELAAIALVTFPSRGFTEPSVKWLGAEVYLLANNYFTDWFFFNYNIGYIYGNADLKHSFHYNASFNFIANKYFGGFVEHFAYLHHTGLHDWGVDGGFFVYPTPRMQIDLSYIRLFNVLGGVHLFGIGFSYNIGLHKDHYRNMVWR